MSARRVALFINSLVRGGTERNVTALCQHMDRTRYVPEVWTISPDGENEKAVRAAGVEIRCLNRGRALSPTFAIRAAREIAHCQADIFHVFLPTMMFYVGVSHLVYRARQPIVFSEATSVVLRPRLQPMRAWLVRKTCSGFAANSDASRKFLSESGIPTDKINLIPNGHEVDQFRRPFDPERVRASLGVKSDERLAIFVGRLVDTKRVCDLLDALRILGDLAGLRVAIVGDGLERPALEEQTLRCGLSDVVQFVGMRPDVTDLLRCADLFVFPSELEGLSNAVIEAALAGLPMIGCDVGGVRDIVTNEREALLVPPRDPQAFAAAMRRYLADWTFARRMGDAARERATAAYAIENTLSRLYRLYDQILSTNTSAPFGGPYPAMGIPKQGESAPSKFVLLVYLGYTVFTLINLPGLLIAIYKMESLPIQPVAFAGAFLLIVPWTKAKPMKGFPYFVVAWAFWIIFAVGGFLGPYRLASFGDKALWQLILKLWISLVGGPILTMRAINREQLPTFFRVSVVVTAIGGLFSIAQVLYYAPFARIVQEPGRGAGLWLNPNCCAQMLGFALFAAFAFPFKSKMTNHILRAMLLLGTLATLSRGGIIILVGGFTVYGIVARKMKVLMQIGAGMLVMVLLGVVMVSYLQTTATKNTSRRLQKFGSLFRGEVAEEGKSMDRLQEWGYGWDGVRRDIIFGRGHRGMDTIVPIAQGVGPHNYYLYIWGNSGIAAIVAYLALLIVLWRAARRCTDLTARGPICAIAAVIPLIGVTDHTFLNNPTLGPYFCMVVATAYYYRPEASKSRAVAYAPVRQLPRGNPEARGS